jgi:diamine N-acetyltransferase
MPVVTKATIDDIDLIRQLSYAIWPNTYGNIISQAQINYMLDKMYNPAVLQKQIQEEGCTFIIVYDNEEAVAFASYNEVATQIWKLNKIYILPSQQGKGMGKFIINYIVNEIKPLHATALQLQVNRQNNATTFYQKLGFTIIQTADFDLGNGYFMNDYVMELRLV